MLIDWRNLFINYEKRGSKKMEVVYNVKYRFKNNEKRTDKELKDLFNIKLLNIILKLKNQDLMLKTAE